LPAATLASQGEDLAPLPVAVPGYEILGELSRGGMGVVYKARQVSLNRLVALKMVLSRAHAGAEDRARFRTEAEAVARLQHPNIIQINDIGEHDGCPYFTMELVSGPTLAQACQGQPQPPPSAAALVETLARAIHCAHQQGIIHRDLKPENVLLQPVGDGPESPGDGNRAVEPGPFFQLSSSMFVPKIIDFGLAKRLDDVGLTRHGVILGTPAYMAPEQVSRKGEMLGPAVDVYALGILLYELLTGRPPFLAESVESILALVATEDPLALRRLQPKVPRDLETICLKCLNKGPARRYASAVDLAEDLRRLQAHEPIAARPPSTWYHWGKFARRHKPLVLGLGGTAAALLLGTTVSVLFALGEGRQRRLADENSRRMHEAQQEAQQDAYQARLAMAQARLEGHGILEAEEQLTKAPVALRRWEWHHLDSRLEDSCAVVGKGQAFTSIPLFLPLRRRVVLTSEDRKVTLWDPENNTCFGPLADGDALGAVSSRTQSLLIVRQRPKGSLLIVNEAGQRGPRIDLSGPLTHFAAALSADGKQLALAWSNATESVLALFDPASGRERARFPVSGSGEILSVAFSPDGARLATGTEGGGVELWDVAAIRHAARWAGHTAPVGSVTFSPDGRRVLSSSADETFRQWDVPTGRVLDVRRGSVGGLQTAAYSPDGQWLATGGRDRALRVWSSAGGEAMAVLHGHTGMIVSVAYSADGRLIGSTSVDGTARLWDAVAQGDARVLRGHTSYVYPVAYSPDGRWIASAGWGNPGGGASPIHLWDAAGGESIAVLHGHSSYVGTLAITPDGRRLVSAGHDSSVRVWDTATGRSRKLPLLLHVFASALVVRIAISPDGNLLAVGDDHRILLWDLGRDEEKATLPVRLAQVRIAVFSPDGTCLAVAGAQPEVQVVRVATGEVMAVLRGHEERFRARRELQDLRPEAERLVGRLYEEEGDAVKVIKRIRSDQTRGETLQRAAWHALLRQETDASAKKRS
jgi:WD40 repeat protein